jgi:hypothetical protein
VVFDLSSENASKKIFLNQATGLQAQERIEVDHILRPSGAKGTDVHKVVISKGDVDATTGAFTQASVELVLRIPRATAFDDTVVKDLTKMMQCLLTNAFVVGLKNGITIEGDYSQSGAFVPA